MALKQLSTKGNGGGAFIDPEAIAQGQAISGYFVDFKDRVAQTKDGRKFTAHDIVIKLKDSGEIKPVSAKGSLKYFKQDFLDEGKVVPGQFVQFTRIADGAKGGVRFAVAADDEDVIDVSAVPGTSTPPTPSKKPASF